MSQVVNLCAGVIYRAVPNAAYWLQDTESAIDSRLKRTRKNSLPFLVNQCYILNAEFIKIFPCCRLEMKKSNQSRRKTLSLRRAN